MQPERTPTESPDEIGYLVMQWKDRPDPYEPWWVHWYYNRVYIPFQRFSFKWFRIPRTKQATVTSDEKGRTITTFSFFENGGFFDDADRADLACVDEQDGYKPMFKNRRIPKESAEIGGPVFPRSKKPARWAKPVMSLVVRDRKRDEQRDRQWRECLARLNRALDQ